MRPCSVRILLPRFVALVLVLVVAVGCGQKTLPTSAPAPTAVKAVATPTPTPTAVEVTKSTFAPRVLAALEDQGSFSAEATVLPDGAWEESIVTANVRMTETGNDVAVLNGAQQVVRKGVAVYFKDSELTRSKQRPWAELNPRSKIAAERKAVAEAQALIGLALAHQVIGGTAFATDFKRGSQLKIDGKDDVQEYFFTVDLREAVASGALGELLNRRFKKTVPKGLSVSVSIDAKDVPRRIEYVLSDGVGTNTHVKVFLRDFGKKLPITV